MSYLAKTVSKGHEYYKVMESYREGGKVKHRVVYNIGTLQNLFRLLPGSVTGEGQSSDAQTPESEAGEVQISPVRCRVHGAPFFLYSLSEWLGIRDELDRVFPGKTEGGADRSLILLLAAIRSVCDPGGQGDLGRWLETTSLPEILKVDPSCMSSSEYEAWMEGISAGQINDFETALHRKIAEEFHGLREKPSPAAADPGECWTVIGGPGVRLAGRWDFRVAVLLSSPWGIPVSTGLCRGNPGGDPALEGLFSEKILEVHRAHGQIADLAGDIENTEPKAPDEEKLRRRAMLFGLGLTLLCAGRAGLKCKFGVGMPLDDLLERLGRVQECRVTVTVRGEQREPVTTLSELQGKDRDTWEMAWVLLTELRQQMTSGVPQPEN